MCALCSTYGVKSKLSTCNSCISVVPYVNAHCSPLVVVTDLHTTSSDGSSILKSDVILVAYYVREKDMTIELLYNATTTLNQYV